MKVRLGVVTLCALLSAVGCGSRTAAITDAIPGVPLTRQRTISRAELGFRWPLSVGIGVLACDREQAILFRTQGTTYQLSGGHSSGPDIAPLQLSEPSGPPSNPLRRVKQDDRMRAFESVSACASRPGDRRCIDETLQRLGLSRDDWTLIEAEGMERRWPPLTRDLMPLDPLLSAGRDLCTK
jgi:hypothetical protein